MLAISALLACAVLALSGFNGLAEGPRTQIRWLLRSRGYKAKVLAANATEGGLQHVEWDGWGGFGAGDTTEYLVFDPTDSLGLTARNRESGKSSELPCAVARVRRLESHWYTVLFYTDSDWDHCP